MWQMFFFRNHTENEAEILVSDPILIFKKALYKVKASGQHISRPQFWHSIKKKKTLQFFRILIQRYAQLRYFIKGSETSHLDMHFVYDFWRKILPILCSTNWPNFSVWLPLLLEIWDNICIVTIFCQICEVINCEMNLSFLIKTFFYVTKKSEQKCKYPKNEKSF